MADQKWSEFPVAETPVSGSDVVVGLQLRSTESDQSNVQYTMDDIASYVLSQDSGMGGGGNSFGKIVVSGQSDVDADSASDTLTLVAGSNITLTTNAGSDSVTIAASGGGGGLVLLEQHTASSSASLDFTTFISSTYDEYVFEIVSILPATDGANLLMRAGTGAGPSWDSGSNYEYAGWISNSGGSTAQQSSASTTSVPVLPGIDNVRASVGTLRLFSPQGGNYKTFTWSALPYSSADAVNQYHAAAAYKSATAMTGVQFLMSSGNIASGTIRVYGLAK